MLNDALGDNSNIQLNAILSQEKIKPQAHSKRSNPHHDHVPSDEMDLLISTINELDLGWYADTCKHQKHHE
jgi:hypothetical protein